MIDPTYHVHIHISGEGIDYMERRMRLIELANLLNTMASAQIVDPRETVVSIAVVLNGQADWQEVT